MKETREESINLYKNRLSFAQTEERIESLLKDFAKELSDLQPQEQEKVKPKFSAANILLWIQDGHAVPPCNQKDLLNYMISFVNHFTLIEQEKPQTAEEMLDKAFEETGLDLTWSQKPLVLNVIRRYATQEYIPTDKELSDIYKLAHKYNFDDFKQFMGKV